MMGIIVIKACMTSSIFRDYRLYDHPNYFVLKVMHVTKSSFYDKIQIDTQW